MVAAALPAEREVAVSTEIRGAPARLWDEGHGEIVISGPAGTGKTRAILEWIHRRCATERLRALLLRKTEESLKASALVTFQEEVLIGFDGRRSDYDGVTFFGGNKIKPAQFAYDETGSIVVVGGLDNPNKVKSSRWDIIFVNEVTELALNDWEMVTGRTDRPMLGPVAPPSVVVGDCNPDTPTHWVKRREADGHLKLWPSRHEDNPAMWDRASGQWTLAGRRYLTRLDKLTGVRYQRLRLGKWVAAEGQVYDAWDDAVHLIDRADVPNKDAMWYVGAADWGWTNPGVLHVWGIDGDGRAYLVAEHYHTERTVEGWWLPRAVEMTTEYDIVAWLCDPSEPQNIALFQAAGLNAVGAINDILPGIDAVQERLRPAGDGRSRLFIVRDCLIERDDRLAEDGRGLPWSTAQEIPRYVWKTNASGIVTKEMPVDLLNHGMDTMRYAILALSAAVPVPQIIVHDAPVAISPV